MKEKSISPLISIVLIIIVSFILISIYFLWIKESATKITDDTDVGFASDFECQIMNLSATCKIYNDEGPIENIVIELDNKSSITFNRINLTIFGVDSSLSSKISSFGKFSSQLNAGVIKVYNTNVDYELLDGAGIDELYNIHEIIIVGDACPNKLIVLNNCSEKEDIDFPEWILSSPNFNYDSGVYIDNISITLSHNNTTCSDCNIYYTLDGEDPDEYSTKYVSSIGPLELGEHTIKAVVVSSDISSDILEKEYLIVEPCDNPLLDVSFEPVEDIFIDSQEVVLSSDTNCSYYTIKYTLDNTDPDSSSLEYISPIIVNETTTIKANVFSIDSNGDIVSGDIQESTYVILSPCNESLGLSTFSPSGLMSIIPLNVSLSYSHSNPPNCSDYDIYYTINGSDPVKGEPSSLRYTSPIKLVSNGDYTIKSRVYAIDSNSQIIYGGVKREEYTIINYCDSPEVPSFDPLGGIYYEPIYVTLDSNCAEDSEHSIYYTIDDKDPTQQSNLYTTPIHLDKNTIVKARVYARSSSGSIVKSAVGDENYVFSEPAPQTINSNGRYYFYNDTEDLISIIGYGLKNHSIIILDPPIEALGEEYTIIDHGIILDEFNLILDIDGASSMDIPVIQEVFEPSICPNGYLAIPGNYLHNTMNDFNGFCVAQYEMKMDFDNDGVGDVAADYGCDIDGGWDYTGRDCLPELLSFVSTAEGSPIVNISQEQSISACEITGSGYDLIDNNQWMTIVRNIELVENNWSNKRIGDKYIPMGNSVPGQILDGFDELTGEQKRTLELTNSKIIWDISGNIDQWLKDTIQQRDMPDGYDEMGSPLTGLGLFEYAEAIGAYNYITYTDLGNTTLRYNDLFLLTSPIYSAVSGSFIGKIISNSNSSDTSISTFLRGGNFSDRYDAGVLTLDLFYDTKTINPKAGFRCIYIDNN